MKTRASSCLARLSHRPLLLLGVGVFLSAPAHLNASPPDLRPVLLVVDDAVLRVAPIGSIARAVGDELRVPILLSGQWGRGGAAGIQGTLTLLVDVPGRLAVSYRTPDGNENDRIVALPSEPVVALQTIALIAANLVRDEAAQLMETLPATAPQAPVTPLSQVPAAALSPPPSDGAMTPRKESRAAYRTGGWTMLGVAAAGLTLAAVGVPFIFGACAECPGCGCTGNNWGWSAAGLITLAAALPVGLTLVLQRDRARPGTVGTVSTVSAMTVPGGGGVCLSGRF